MVKRVIYMGVVVVFILAPVAHSFGHDDMLQKESTLRALEIDNEQSIEGFDELDDLIDEAINSGAFKAVSLREPSSAEVLARRVACFVFIKYLSLYSVMASGIETVTSYIMSAWYFLWGKNQQEASPNGEN